ncbi:hypothetical protein PV05_06588 [Exophiala xenobiotica]|uniref:Polycomb protein VEFS-Box domain-containing protein n=1 Tax=Exophiala xenobiotica TaxID=348802 RepID=A0A0D2CVS2_9EURO|nr:uncharacterized protein PV05_06588 [Exophiala xenobiotica]KIW54217.1 hypothetical protein PV05_06588 [Exophiala xenobiotica]
MLNSVYGSNLSRPERRFSRHLIGDLTFAFHQSQTRQKTFLDRNITRILDHHQKLREVKPTSGNPARPSTAATQRSGRSSAKEASTGSVAAGDALWERLSATEGPSKAPAVPSTMPRPSHSSLQNGETLQAQRKTRRSIRGLSGRVYEEADAELTLDLNNIRKKLNFKTNTVDEGQRPSKRQKCETVKCQCYLTIWDNRDGYATAPLVSKSEYCYVTTRETEYSGSFVDLELDKAFTVRASELKVSVQEKNEHVFALIDKYFLELKIIPCRTDSRWPPIPLLGKSDGDHFAPDIKRNGAELLQGSVAARYTHLPQAPESDTPLSVFFLHEGRTYRTKYGLQVSSIWQKSGSGSIAARRPRNGIDLDSFRSPEQKALASPGVNEANTAIRPKRDTNGIGSTNGTKNDTNGVQAPSPSNPPEVCYNLCSNVDQKFRYATVKGYRCPLCAVWKTSKLDRLIFHLSTMHSKYIFQVQKPQRDPVSKDLTHIQIKVDRAPQVKKEEHLLQIDWQAPPEPFNLPAYSEGVRDWVGSPSLKKHASEDTTTSTLVSSRQQLSSQFPSARDVPGFRQPKRKRFRAIQLQSQYADAEPVYTSVSHRPVSPSEDPRSETDEDIDNEWQIELHMERLDLVSKRQGWTDHERELSKRWNRHRMEERLEHSRYLPNSMVRFVRKHHRWLKNGNDELLQAFFGLLERLKESSVIDDDVVSDVNTLIFQDSPPPEPAAKGKQSVQNSVAERESPRARRTRRGGSVLGTPRGEPSRPRITPVMDSPDHVQARSTLARPFTCGHCSKPVTRATKEAVWCADPECKSPRVMYHRRCAKEQQGLGSQKGRKDMAEIGQASAVDTTRRPAFGGAAAKHEPDLTNWSCQSCTRRQNERIREQELAVSAAAAAAVREIAMS